MEETFTHKSFRVARLVSEDRAYVQLQLGPGSAGAANVIESLDRFQQRVADALRGALTAEPHRVDVVLFPLTATLFLEDKDATAIYATVLKTVAGILADKQQQHALRVGNGDRFLYYPPQMSEWPWGLVTGLYMACGFTLDVESPFDVDLGFDPSSALTLSGVFFRWIQNLDNVVELKVRSLRTARRLIQAFKMPNLLRLRLWHGELDATAVPSPRVPGDEYPATETWCAVTPTDKLTQEAERGAFKAIMDMWVPNVVPVGCKQLTVMPHDVQRGWPGHWYNLPSVWENAQNVKRVNAVVLRTTSQADKNDELIVISCGDERSPASWAPFELSEPPSWRLDAYGKTVLEYYKTRSSASSPSSRATMLQRLADLAHAELSETAPPPPPPTLGVGRLVQHDMPPSWLTTRSAYDRTPADQRRRTDYVVPPIVDRVRLV